MEPDESTADRRGAVGTDGGAEREDAGVGGPDRRDDRGDRATVRGGRFGDVAAGVAATVPWPLAIVTGGVAYLAGYLCTALLFVVGPASFGSIGRASERLKIVGFVFNNQHFVDVVVADSSGAVIQRGNIILQGSTSSLPPAVYFAVPVVVLLVAGFLFARRQYGATDGYAVSGLTGGGMALGYAGVGYLATFVFVRSDRFGNTASVDGTGILLMGVLYGLVLGSVGCLTALAWIRSVAGGESTG